MRATILWATATMAALGVGCRNEPDGALGFELLATCLRVDQAQERTFRTAEEWSRFVASYPGGNAGAPVDFSRSMVAARFDGAGSACVGFTVDGASIADGVTVVRATRHTSPDPCIAVLAYPQLVLAVPRADGPVAFRIADARDTPPGQTPACR